jgi:AraC-like DNA-binding protein
VASVLLWCVGMLIDPRTFRRVVEVRQRLLANEDVTVGDLADRVDMSAARLIRVFAALFGTTPHQLRTQVRLDRARELLAHGGGVTDVCMEVGFSSLGSFSALFTRWTGAPPSRYRKIVQVPATFTNEPLVPGCLGMLGCLPRNFREASLH